MQHEGLVIVVYLLRVPIRGQLGFQNSMGGPDIDVRRQQAKTDGNAMMMAVYGKRGKP